MAAAGFAAVLDVNPEQHRLGFPLAMGAGPIANSSENNLIGWSFRLSGPAQAITGIANTVRESTGTINATGTEICIEAGSGQRIKESSVEIPKCPALAVTDVGPTAVDARIAFQRISYWHTIHLPDWGAHLAAVSNMAHAEGG